MVKTTLFDALAHRKIWRVRLASCVLKMPALSIAMKVGMRWT